jgi:hypothetical protein
MLYHPVISSPSRHQFRDLPVGQRVYVIFALASHVQSNRRHGPSSVDTRTMRESDFCPRSRSEVSRKMRISSDVAQSGQYL